jgi:hypothetical protein
MNRALLFHAAPRAAGLGVLMIVALVPLTLLMRRLIVRVSGQQR